MHTVEGFYLKGVGMFQKYFECCNGLSERKTYRFGNRLSIS